MAAYTNPLKIANGLMLDFTVEGANTSLDSFLGVSSTGQVTSFASVPRTRVSGGGNLTEATSAVLTITGGTASILTSGLTIQVKLAGSAQSGYLSSTDWNTFNDKLSTSLTDGQIWIGNVSNVATARTISGDITISNTGVAAIAAGAIVNADVNASAAIDFSKLQNGDALSVLGRASNSSGAVDEIVAGTDHNIMRRSGTAIAFGSINLAQAGAVGSSILPIVNGGTGSASGAGLLSGLTANRIPYASSATALANGPFWDAANAYLGVGIAPTSGLHLSGSSANSSLIQVIQTGASASGIVLQRTGTSPTYWNISASASTTTLRFKDLADATIGSLSASGIWASAGLTIAANSTTLADQTSHLNFTGTMPTTITGTTSGATFAYTSAGSSAFSNRALSITYNAGYTGTAQTAGISVTNAVAGTGTTLIPAADSNTMTGNHALRGLSTATTVGINVGMTGSASGGSVNVGMLGLAQVPKSSSTSIGVVGSAINTLGSGLEIGGWFSLNQTVVPTFSAALIADNGALANHIFVGQDNGSTVFTIADGGAVTATSTLSALSLTATGLTSGRVPIVSTGGLLVDDSDMTFSVATLTVTNIIGSTSITASNLTSGRVVIAGASGQLVDDSDLTFSGSTLTATNLIVTTGLTNSALTSGRVVIAGASGILADDSDLTFSGSTTTMTNAVVSTLLTATTALNVGGNASAAGILRIYEQTPGVNFTAFTVGTQAADLTYTLPTAYPSITGYVLSATTAGVMSWIANTAITGLTTNRVIYATSSTTIGDDSAFTWDSTNNALTVSDAVIHTHGNFNTFIGASAGNFTLSGIANVAVGGNNGQSLTSGSHNTLLGYSAGFLMSSGGYNVAIGSNAMVAASASSFSVAIGYEALKTVTSAVSNTAIGYRALRLLTSGENNIVVGQAGTNATTGSNNVLVGSSAGSTITTTSDNVAIGYQALVSTTGSANIGIGYNANANGTSGSYNIAIGYRSDVASATADGQLNIQNIIWGTGNTAITTNVSTGMIGIGINASLGARLHVKGENNTLALLVEDDAGNDIFAAGESANARVIGVFGVTPVIRQTTTSQTAATFVANTSLIANDTATWNGYTVGDIIAIFQAYGWLT